MSTLKSADIEQAYGRGQFDIGVVMSVAADTVQGRAADPRWVLRREALAWVAAPALAAHIPDPLPLVLLSDDCLLHQAAVRALNQQNIHHVMVHSASGVAGLQSVLAAGLGVGCLCASAVGEGVVRLGARHGLPALKEEAVFSLLPPRQNESAAVARAREVLARQLLV
jgi:DNA-binding transcriptional LysR family regulator